MLNKYKSLKDKKVIEMKERNDGSIIVEAQQFDQDTGEPKGVRVLEVIPKRLQEKKAQLEAELESVNEALADYKLLKSKKG